MVLFDLIGTDGYKCKKILVLHKKMSLLDKNTSIKQENTSSRLVSFRVWLIQLIFQTLPFHLSHNLPCISPVVLRFNFRNQMQIRLTVHQRMFQRLVRVNTLTWTLQGAAPLFFHWVCRLGSVITPALNWQIGRYSLKGESQWDLARTQAGLTGWA